MAASPCRRVVPAWMLALAFAACRQPENTAAARDWPAGELRSGGAPVAVALAPGEVHRYRLPLRKGLLLRLVVDQQGIDAVVGLDAPAGARVLEADRPIGDRGPELLLAVAERDGVHTLIVRGLESVPGRYRARVETLRPALAADRRSAQAYRTFTQARGLAPEEALERWTRALAVWRELGETALAGEALERIAKHHYDRREHEQAAELYHEAATAFARAGDRRREAIARTDLGANLLPLAKAQEAANEYALALPVARQEGDRLLEAKALHGLGQALQNQGELQAALDRYREALALWPKDDRQLRPYTLNNLGVLYARLLGDERRGRELLVAARDAWLPGFESWKARTLRQLGQLAYRQGRLAEARQHFGAALALRRESDPCGSAALLASVALVEERQGARPAADEHLAGALRIVQTQSCPRSEPTVYLLAAGLAERRGDEAMARQRYHRSEALFAAQGDRMARGESLAGIARAARAEGDFKAARQASRRALDIVEGVRPTVLREDFRTSFFAGARSLFDAHIDLLLEMGATDEAWATAEQARARVLSDLLAEAGAGLRRTAAPTLVTRERALQRQLNALESQRLVTSEAREESLRSLQQEIDARVAELESARGEIRRRSPVHALLFRPEPVSLAAVRRELLDADTVLLEYRLGETASHLWVVTRESLVAARLPPRREVESRAREAGRWLRSLEWPGRNPPVLCELSRMLLEPAVPYLGRRRLVVVADGALEALPFAALHAPSDSVACSDAAPLVNTHEIAYLPSAAALLAQRRLLDGRRPAPGWLAVVADPVYGSSRRFRPLPGSAREATAITAGLPPDKIFVATGAAASRQSVLRGPLRGFRILHFAAHGVLDAEQPLLSALALSHADAAGRPVAGVLPAHEIYDLDLPAELVVLSACETALGRQVPGEGLVSGLPRAFLYAGAARVVVSLWEVPDDSTRELMTRFYRGLFDQGLAPARALQEAQLALQRAGRHPRHWAGFVLLGDWRPLPPFSR